MNGAILGMTKREIAAKLDEIVDFSGCERYLDTPVKRYSSGMMVRLGFAVAAHLDPEILVVDEVLAVGDAEFQKKAIGKMQDVSRGEGRTVLFVSHNMASVRQLCTSGVLLENGMVKLRGGIDEVVDFYMGGNAKDVSDCSLLENKQLEKYRLKDCSSRQMKISRIERISPYVVDSKNSLTFKVCFIRIDLSVKKVCLNTLVEDILTDNRVGLTCSEVFDLSTDKNEYEFEVTLNHLNLKPGTYKVDFWLSAEPIVNSWNLYDAVYDALTFEVQTYNNKIFGLWDSTFGFNYFDGCENKLTEK